MDFDLLINIYIYFLHIFTTTKVLVNNLIVYDTKIYPFHGFKNRSHILVSVLNHET